jgi:hypothetical protein
LVLGVQAVIHRILFQAIHQPLVVLLLLVVVEEVHKILHNPVVMGVRVAVAVQPAAVLEIHLLCPRLKEATVEVVAEPHRTMGQAVVAVLRLLAQMEIQLLLEMVATELHLQSAAHP